ncbi:hypothetical protein FSP39_019681 [Pinctada imbricata]|uniref:Uncharacterized protein n=1 Tax=Pinctada imbricata TaxID=66713 RepID=A0AA88YW65_PINIB|nr:hypothetical protein FSP39_019681 [Pinctada imbricata]
MDGGKLYIPNAQKWIKFYTQLSKGMVNPYADHTYKGYQRGGGLKNNTSPFMMPIDKYTKESNDEATQLQINMTSPAEQVVQQAKSEVAQENLVKKRNKKRKHKNIKASSKLERQKNRRLKTASKKRKVVKLQSDVFGVY